MYVREFSHGALHLYPLIRWVPTLNEEDLVKKKICGTA
jgi:hypothetical protein